MTVRHLIEVLQKFDENEKIYIRMKDNFGESHYIEIDACVGIDIFYRPEKGIIIDLTDCCY